jgi:hypothetical protein
LRFSILPAGFIKFGKPYACSALIATGFYH